MEKRTLLAIVVSIAILLLWDFFLIQPRVEKDATVKTQEAAEPPATQKQEPASIDIPTLLATPQAAGTDETVVIETPLYRAVWASEGGRLVSLKLTGFRETMDPGADIVEMITSPLPTITMSGGFSDAGIRYRPSHTGTVMVEQERLDVSFQAQVAEGIILTKTFTIDPASYTIAYQTQVANQTPNPASLQMTLLLDNIYPLDDKGSRYTFAGPVLLNGKHLEEFKLSKVKKPGVYRDFSGEIKWFGFEDKYFLKVMIPMEPPQETSLTIKRRDAEHIDLHYAVPTTVIEPDKVVTTPYLIYIGPKELKTLQASGYGLKRALDFGFFDLIAKPMLMAMNWIYSYTRSYGWSIIILTFFIKLLLYPLSLKSFTSMKGLQKIQPLMKELQEKYKDDKQRLNQELMKLYSEHKINPMGGCLPMLLQIPILFALYRVFLSAIELRHTPFYIMGTWLPDLSAKDPYYITPILMGLSQFVMQKMTPTTGDPTQQKMMLFMPVVFTFLFLSFPSGLVLYWLISNILSILQQAYINRTHS